MTVDQFPLGSASNSGRETDSSGIDPNTSIHEQDLSYTNSRLSGRIWLVYYSAGKWWQQRRDAAKITILAIPIIVLLFVVLLLSIAYSSALNRLKTSQTTCVSADCVRAAGRIIRHMNLTQNPCKNFYEYACGGYSLYEEIPIGKKMSTQFTKREAILMKQLKKVIEKPLVTDDIVVRNVRTYYKSCMNTLTIEVNGDKKLRKMVAEIGGLHLLENATFDTTDWKFEDALARRSRFTMRGIFQMGVSPDYYDNSKNVIILDRGRLGLGRNSRIFYLNKSLKDDTVLSAYIEMLMNYAASILGRDKVDKESVADVVALEQKLAGIHSTPGDRRSIKNLYREISVGELMKNASYLKWDSFMTSVFKAVDLDVTIDLDEIVVVLDYPYFESLGGVLDHYTNTPSGIKTLQNYITMLAVMTYAPRMGYRFKSAYATFSKVFSGNRGEPEPWLDCLADTNYKLAFPLGKMYLDRFSPATQKYRAHALASDIKKAYRGLIAKAFWMDTKTRRNALKKLDALKYEMAYPRWLRDSDFIYFHYLNFTITHDYTENVFNYYNHSIRMALRKYRHAPDSAHEWDIPPQTVNGMYEMTENKLYVAAALIEEPFFHHAEGLPEALNYGSLGVMTGHELSHAFDDKGMAFDEKGNIRNWWTTPTLATFRNHTQCFVKQFSAYSIDSQRVDGKRTLAENMADSSGLRSARAAYKQAIAEGRVQDKGKRLPGLNLTPDQLFFVSYAQTYCTLLTKQALRNQVLESIHSPSAVRVVGTLASSHDFAEAFQCQEVTTMNRQDKCYIW